MPFEDGQKITAGDIVSDGGDITIQQVMEKIEGLDEEEVVLLLERLIDKKNHELIEQLFARLDEQFVDRLVERLLSRISVAVKGAGKEPARRALNDAERIIVDRAREVADLEVQAQAAALQGDYEEAEHLLAQAELAVLDQAFELLSARGNLLYFQGLYDESIGPFEKAVALNPEDPVAGLNLAIAHQQAHFGSVAEHQARAVELHAATLRHFALIHIAAKGFTHPNQYPYPSPLEFQAIEALGVVASKPEFHGSALRTEAVEALAERLREGCHWDIGAVIASALGEFGEDAVDAVPALVRGLRDDDVGRSAARTLGRIGPAAGREALEGLQWFRNSCPVPGAKEIATEAIWQIDPQCSEIISSFEGMTVIQTSHVLGLKLRNGTGDKLEVLSVRLDISGAYDPKPSPVQLEYLSTLTLVFEETSAPVHNSSAELLAGSVGTWGLSLDGLRDHFAGDDAGRVSGVFITVGYGYGTSTEEALKEVTLYFRWSRLPALQQFNTQLHVMLEGDD